MRTIRVTESKTTTLALSEEEAERLRRLGRKLASSSTYWGSAREEQPRHKTVIRCERKAHGRYEVRVAEAIGAVAAGNLQLLVEPKIPLSHLTYILQEGGQLPRVADGRAELQSDENFLNLIAFWFVQAAEELLRHDLIRDYSTINADRAAARGRIDPIPTARSLLRGRPSLRCTFDELTVDNPLNRVLSAASRAVISNPTLPKAVRQRARRIELRLSGVGPVLHDDLRAEPDARSRHYCDAHVLGKSLLAGLGTSQTSGAGPAWTFLFRTPEPVEEGIRQILKQRLGPAWNVRKKGRALAGASPRTLNPDLVFGEDDAIGDVKYRLSTGAIQTSHLYQVTSFAAGYRTPHGLLIEFGDDQTGDHVEVGSIRVRAVNWNTGVNDPSAAADQLCQQVEEWLNSEVVV